MSHKIDINGDNPTKNYGSMATLAQVSTNRIYLEQRAEYNILSKFKIRVGVRNHSTEFFISGIGHGIDDVNDRHPRFV